MFLTQIVNSRLYLLLLCSERRDERGGDEGKGREGEKEQPAMKKYEEPKAPVSLNQFNITCGLGIRGMKHIFSRVRVVLVLTLH